MSWIASLAGGALLLCLVALINGGPIYYPDTGSYIIDGQRLVELTRPLNVRPVFYGLAIWFLHWNRTLWPVIFVQGLVMIHLVGLTMRVLGVRLTPWGLVATAACLATLTPLAWYVAHVLPDVFTGAVILSLYLLAFCRDRLSRGETVYLVLLGAAAISFHLTHLVIAAAIGGATCAGWALWPAIRRETRPLLALAPLLLALAGMILFSLALYQRLTLTPNSPPHFMARLIADGPGRAYLRQACPTRHFALCQNLDTLPASEDGILWGYLPWVPPEQGALIRAQAGDVVRGTIETHPVAVISHMLANTARQLVTFDSGLQVDQDFWTKLPASGMFYAGEIGRTRQAHGELGGEALAGINAAHALLAFASFLACLWLARSCLTRRMYRPALLIGVIFLGLLVNAFASGALGGVFGRYQGRVIWLLPFGALTVGLAVSRLRAPALLAAARNE